MVGLADKAADRRVGTYSLGMRQRLGIGQALLGRPRALILDEPANGLDPEGIAWMRVLLRDYADRGGTVLLSSHLLGEVQATVDRLVVISAGRIVAQGALDDLLTSTGLLLRATDTAALRRALDHALIDHRPHQDGTVIVDKHDGVDAERLARIAAAAGVLLVELRDGDRPGLEQLFFSLTGGVRTAPTAVAPTLEVQR
jgi:ABC-2 type transport system ATP-binding protein